MEDWQYILIFIFVIMLAVGVILGLYLANHADHVDDDEEHESDAQYGDVFNEKYKSNGPKS